MSDLYVGLMSGTSVDALDIALCRFHPQFEIVAAADYPFQEALRQRINQACLDRPMHLDELLQLEQDYTEFCAASVGKFLDEHAEEREHIRAIGFHGQTLRHRPDIGTTLQMANPSLLAEHTGIDVIADFRRRDLAADGEGAPLVPAFHQYLTAQMQRPLGILNLGGIANLSLFSEDDKVEGFDTGPANTLLDQWIGLNLHRTYDENGSWAATGVVNESLLKTLLQEPYFAKPAPKSTGRELFNMAWLEAALAQQPILEPQDVQRTLVELTAVTVAQSLRHPPPKLIVCGGGASNSLLMSRLSAHLPQTEVYSSDTLGWPASHIEAAAFAWLAMCHVKRDAGNLPSTTGARGPRVLGALYPG